MAVAAELRYATGFDPEEVGGFVRHDYVPAETSMDFGGDLAATPAKEHPRESTRLSRVELER